VRRTTLGIKRNKKPEKQGKNFSRSFRQKPTHFLFQFGGNKQENRIGLGGKNKRLKSIVKTKRRWLKGRKGN